MSRLARDQLTLMPLGGVGEIGRNMMFLEIANRLLLIDCGVHFPSASEPGVDVILPDFSPIRDRLSEVEALVLTHAHEDHIGAVPYLLALQPDMLVLGSKLTLAILAEKCREHGLSPDLVVVRESQRVRTGNFELEFIPVSHSIPDAMAVFISTRAGSIFHTGDFKLDQLPVGRKPTDLAAMARLGEEGVDLLVCDSTRADVAGYVEEEREIGPVLDKLIAEASAKVVVSSFSSHVARVQQILWAAQKAGRSATFLGRSMLRNMAVAERLGYLKVPKGLVVSQETAQTVSDENIVYICTGSQGESLAVLSRMAQGTYPVSINPGDRVIFASSRVPGNETAVFGMINQFYRLGAEVFSRDNARVHVSGHAPAGELVYVYNLLKPKAALPVHGEPRHLVAGARIAQKTGVDPDQIFVIENGQSLVMQGGRVSLGERVRLESVYVDGGRVGTVTRVDLRDRVNLSQEGLVAVTVILGREDGDIIEIRLNPRGFAEGDEVLLQMRSEVEKIFLDLDVAELEDLDRLTAQVRRSVGRWIKQKYRRFPVLVVQVVVV